jgi:hypothetical protein
VLSHTSPEAATALSMVTNLRHHALFDRVGCDLFCLVTADEVENGRRACLWIDARANYGSPRETIDKSLCAKAGMDLR